MREWSKRRAYDSEYVTRPVPPDPLIPLDEMIRRIELARLAEAPPICTACGSATPKRPQQKWCPTCGRMLAAECFSRDRKASDGHRWACKGCEVDRNKAYRRTVAKAAGIGVSGRVVRVSGRMGRAS